MAVDEMVLDFDPLHTLGFLATDWVEHHCKVPGGVFEGDPLLFRGWQVFVTVNHYRVRPDAVADERRVSAPFWYRRSVIVGPQKALALDTPIPVPGGWSTMAGLQVGDLVFSEAGKPVTVVAKSPVWRSDTYRVTFSDGASLVACGDHEWLVERRTPSGTYVPDRVTTAELVGQLVDVGGARRFRVSNASPLILPDVDLPIPPYTLGAWLGDGDSDSARITGVDEGVFERVAAEGFTVTRQRGARRGVLGLMPLLRAAGLLRNKYVPSAYLRASETQRWELLQGLMDTDGHASQRGVCEFTTTSPAIRDGIRELIATLGLRTQCFEGTATLCGRVIGPKWRIQFSARSDSPVFGLQRKQSRLLDAGGSHAQFRHRRIIAVEPVEPVETQCITVDSDSHVFLAGREMIPTGNCGKSPWGAGFLLFEGVGPALFAGWAAGGERYRCKDHGCGCGWEYHYQPGEAMGRPRRKSLLGLLAFAESQTSNVYEPLQTMIHSGPLCEFVHVREGFIRLPNRGKIVPLSSAARSKLGQPLTGGLGDESGLYTASNRVLGTWQTMRRGIAAMQGRSVELTNPWDPMEDSAAQQAFESRRPDIFRYYRKPPVELSYKNKRERHRIHRYVYADAPWVDVAGIDAEAAELMETDPAQAERFYGNRLVQGLGSFLTEASWDGNEAPVASAERRICLGFDGSRSNDWTALRAETIDGYRFTPRYGPDDRPTWWRPDEWGGRIPRGEVLAAVADLFARYDVARMYVDPRYYETQADQWVAEFGEDRVVPWPTNQVVRMHSALLRYREDVAEGSTTHDGDPSVRLHALAARRVAKPGERFMLGKPSENQKIDLIMADVLAHEAAADARAAGWAAAAADTRVIIFRR